MTSPPEPSATPAATTTPESPDTRSDNSTVTSADGTPTDSSNPEPPSFGWTVYAERLNGRFAMVGFIALLILELWTRQDFFTWLGLP